MRLKLLARRDLVTDTRSTYHRTWEKGLKPVTRVAGFNPQFFTRHSIHPFGVFSSIAVIFDSGERAHTFRTLPSISNSGVVMQRVLLFVLSIVLLASFSFASTEGDRAKLEDRLDDAATIMNEIMAAPDKGIPEEVLNSAQCVAVVPSMIKASLGFGGQ